MKKKISLPVMAVSAILLLGGCGTQMYDLSEDEENLVVQYSAHILAKYNIEQKDGMTAASSEVTSSRNWSSSTCSAFRIRIIRKIKPSTLTRATPDRSDNKSIKEVSSSSVRNL